MATDFPKEQIISSRKRPKVKYEFQPKVQYMKTAIRGLKVISIWPVENTTLWKIVRFHIIVWLTIASSISFILTFIIRVIQEGGSMDGIAETIDFVTVFISATFRYGFVYIKRDKYRHMVDLIHDNFIYYPLFPSEKKISLNKYVRIANHIVTFFFAFTIFWVVQMHYTPLMAYFWKIAQVRQYEMSGNTTYEQPHIEYPIILKSYVPFDISKQPNHSIFYIYQIFFFTMYAVLYVVVDYFWCMTIMLTIGQFVLLKVSLNTIRQSIKDDKSNELLEQDKFEEVEDQLNHCIKHHQFLRKIICMIEDQTNAIILVDALHAVISIAFLLLDITIAINNKDWNKLLYSLEFFMTSIFHMLWFDWLGNELAEREEEIAETIYNIGWYKCPSQKSKVLIISTLSRHPHRLTGGKMYHVQLQIFTSVMKMIFSYFMFLFQLRNGT